VLSGALNPYVHLHAADIACTKFLRVSQQEDSSVCECVLRCAQVHESMMEAYESRLEETEVQLAKAKRQNQQLETRSAFIQNQNHVIVPASAFF